MYGLEVRGVIYGLIFGKFIALLLGWLRTDATLTWPSTEMAKSLFNFSKYSLVTNLGGYVYNWMDILIIGFFLGPAAVGIYEIAWRITGVVILFSSSISISIFPEISRLDSESNHGEIEKLLPNAITPSLFFILPAFVGTVLLSQEILTFVFGSSYAAGWIVLIILMGDKIAQGFQLVLGNALQAIDRPDQAAVAAVASMALNLLLNVVLVWQLGIVGAAVGTVIASVTNDVVHYRFLSREIRITWPYRELAWCTFASVVMGLLLIGVTSIMEIGSTYLLSGIIILGAAIYFPVALVHPSVRELMRSYVPYK